MKHSFFFLIILILTSCSNSAEEIKTTPSGAIFSTDFSQANHLEPPWLLTGLAADASIDTIRATKDGKINVPATQLIKSPIFSIDALEYYRLSFRLQATEKTYWAMVFFDANDRMLLADLYSSIDANTKAEDYTFYFQSKADAVRAQFWVRPATNTGSAALEQVSIEPVGNKEEIILWADSVYRTIPPLENIDVPSNQEVMLPLTMQALKEGKPWRVVMLGNSIINDTGNSAWEILVEQNYPGADLEVITSVRGGTGCWYYQEANRVDTFVLRYDPDLLIIGGISHRNDTAAIHNVIRQVQARSDTEILVMSGPVGREGDPRSNPDFTIPPKGDDFRLQLLAMCEDAQVAYFDMQTEWGKYIQTSNRPYDFFLRDPVHANARGRQVLARIMEAYFIVN